MKNPNLFPFVNLLEANLNRSLQAFPLVCFAYSDPFLSVLVMTET